MADLSALQRRFGRHDDIRFDSGRNGLKRVSVRTEQAEAEVYLHGAQVTHYQSRGESAVLFVSARSAFASGSPIRGGIPIVFPWFGAHRSDAAAPMHGFARLLEWEVESVERVNGGARVALSLGSEAVGEGSPVGPFRLRYTIGVGRALDLDLEVHNSGEGPVRFDEALHAYFAVADAQRVTVTGLTGSTYLDKTCDMQPVTQGPEPIALAGETDRVYQNSVGDCVIHDPAGGRRIRVKKRNSRSTVVWNPWIERSRKIPDFGDDEWRRMVCVEPGNVRDHAVTLEAGARHVLGASIEVSRDGGA